MSVALPRTMPPPFRGLAPFGDGELDALLFFGRERETAIVTANLLASRLTVLYGPSGVGKSSLLHAGVARRIRELAARRAIGRGPDGAVVVFSAWADDPVTAIAAAIGDEVRAAVGAPVAEPAPGASLADTVSHWAAVLDGDLFLVLDQLEEHFVYHDDGRASGTLVAELPDVILRPHLGAHVLLSLRDDALSQLDRFGGALPNLFANVVRLDPLDRAAATAAILGPVQRFDDLVPADERVHVEPELVDAVLDQAATEGDPARVEAPYLQLVMERVWNEELGRGSRVLRASTLEELGGAGEIVREHLDDALAVLDAGGQEVAARMFEHLVTPSGTKIAHRAADLAQFARAPEPEVGPVLSALEHERILRQVDEGSSGDARYEIFHDVLAGAILDWRRRREVTEERLALRRHQRRLVVFALAALAAVLVMAAVTVFALTQRGSARGAARTARGRALDAVALNELVRDPELSLVLARRAAGLSSSPLAETTLRQALLQSRLRRAVRLGAPALAAVFLPDGRAAAVSATGRVVVADPASGRVVREFATGGRRALLDPSGRSVLAFGLGRPPTLFRLATGRAVRLATRSVTGAAFSRDGRILVTLDPGRLVHVWDAATGRELRVLETARPAQLVAVSPGDASLVVGGGLEGHLVETFSLASGARVASFRHPSVVTRLAFGPSAALVAVAGRDRTVTLVRPRTGVAVATLTGQTGAITDVAFSPRGELVATSSTDGTARLYDLHGSFVTSFVGHGLDVTSVGFSSDASLVLTTSKDGTARVWDAQGGLTLALLAGHGDEVTSAVFSRNDRSVLTAGADGTMRVWYAAPEPALAVARRAPPPLAAARPAGGRIVLAPPGAPDVSVSADGSLFATTIGRRLVVRRVTGGATVLAIRVPVRVTGVALAPDGGTVAAAGSDGQVRLYRRDGKLVRRYDGGTAPLTRVAFDASGTRLAAGSTDHDARVWDVATGHVRVFAGHTDTVNAARFSPDGSRLLTASRDHDVVVWDVASGTKVPDGVLRAAFGEVSDAAFSPDGRWIVTAGPSKAGLFDARTFARLFYLRGHAGKLTSASFASDGVTIVTSGIDGTARTYRCDLCVDLAGLERLADARLPATGRTLTAAEERELLP